MAVEQITVAEWRVLLDKLSVPPSPEDVRTSHEWAALFGYSHKTMLRLLRCGKELGLLEVVHGVPREALDGRRMPLVGYRLLAEPRTNGKA